jgi:8-oxo-dGTP pyrophosphatase MutT (NUDIX family)
MKSRPSWFYRQSGVIPYRAGASGREILLITSRRRGRWIIPKGIIDPGTTPVGSACKEAYEEAGIRGRPTPEPLGEYQYCKWGGVCTVQVFALEVSIELEAWPESSVRRRQWMSVEEAANAVDEGELKQLILRMPCEKRFSPGS